MLTRQSEVAKRGAGGVKAGVERGKYVAVRGGLLKYQKGGCWEATIVYITSGREGEARQGKAREGSVLYLLTCPPARLPACRVCRSPAHTHMPPSLPPSTSLAP